MPRLFQFFLFSLLLPFLAQGQDPFSGELSLEEPAGATVIPEASVVEPGDYFRVAFKLNLKPHYHAYYKNPGTLGMAPSVEWELPEGFTAGELVFPIPEAIKSSATGAEAISYGYEGQITFLAQIDPSADIEAGKDYTIKGVFNWQECDATCIQGDQEFSFTVQTGQETVFLEQHEELFSNAAKMVSQDNSA